MKRNISYSDKWPLDKKIVYVLGLFKAASVEEITSEIVELEGIAAEEAVARMQIEVEEEIKRLEESGKVKKMESANCRYALKMIE